jgi:transposase
MNQSDLKRQALREQGALHPRPLAVQDQLFHGSDFFDPQDLVQVKYEMLRCVRIDGRSASEAAKQFGFSRMAFYQALAAYRRAGLPGLIPSKRGPKRRHKLTDAVMNVIVEQRTADRACSAAALAEHVRQRLGIIIHRRSIERVLAGAAKKGRLPSSA